MSEERSHSKLGASKAARWLACPGSVALCATLPDPPSTTYAREGQAAHYVAEQCLRGGHDPHDFVGRKLDGFAEVDCTPEMADAVEVFVKLCRGAQDAAGATTWIEHPFALLDFDGDLFGHNDFAAFDAKSGKLVVVDYKHGAGVTVEVEGNKQLMYYALGALMQIPRGVTQVDIVVVQPRGRGEAIKRWSCDPMDLLAYGGELADGAERTRQPDAPLCPGSHCQFCPAKTFAACPALAAAAESVVLDEFADLKDATATLAEANPDTLAELLERVPVIKMWIGAIEKLALSRALKGDTPTGFKLVATSPRRAWKDGELTMRQASKAFDIPLSKLIKETPLSPAEFEKVAGKSADVATYVKAYLATPKPGYALAPLSDKRAPVTPPSDSEFNDIGDTDDEA